MDKKEFMKKLDDKEFVRELVDVFKQMEAYVRREGALDKSLWENKRFQLMADIMGVKNPYKDKE